MDISKQDMLAIYVNINHLHKDNIEIFTMVLKFKLTKIKKEEAWLLYRRNYLERGKLCNAHMKHGYFEARDSCYLNINHLH
jgi:hypothetical protein